MRECGVPNAMRLSAGSNRRLPAERASDEEASPVDEDVAALAMARRDAAVAQDCRRGTLMTGLAQLLSGGWTGQPRAICLLHGRCKWPVYRSS